MCTSAQGLWGAENWDEGRTHLLTQDRPQGESQVCLADLSRPDHSSKVHSSSTALQGWGRGWVKHLPYTEALLDSISGPTQTQLPATKQKWPLQAPTLARGGAHPQPRGSTSSGASRTHRQGFMLGPHPKGEGVTPWRCGDGVPTLLSQEEDSPKESGSSNPC